jgi:hypothetical protein
MFSVPASCCPFNSAIASLNPLPFDLNTNPHFYNDLKRLRDGGQSFQESLRLIARFFQELSVKFGTGSWEVSA